MIDNGYKVHPSDFLAKNGDVVINMAGGQHTATESHYPKRPADPLDPVAIHNGMKEGRLPFGVYGFTFELYEEPGTDGKGKIPAEIYAQKFAQGIIPLAAPRIDEEGQITSTWSLHDAMHVRDYSRLFTAEGMSDWTRFAAQGAIRNSAEMIFTILFDRLVDAVGQLERERQLNRVSWRKYSYYAFAK